MVTMLDLVGVPRSGVTQNLWPKKSAGFFLYMLKFARSNAEHQSSGVDSLIS